jgi:hypothetical protein
LVETIHAIEKKSSEPRLVYVVVPFVSEVAKEKMNDLISKSHLKLELITGPRTIRNAGDDLTPEEKSLFHDLIPNLTYTSEIGSYLTVTDWRIPDNMPTGFGGWGMQIPDVTELEGNNRFIARSDVVKRPYAWVNGG